MRAGGDDGTMDVRPVSCGEDMKAQITLTLPEDVLRRAEALARHAGRPVADVLTDAINASLRPLGALADDGTYIETLPDEAGLAAADSTMAPADHPRPATMLVPHQARPPQPAAHADLASRVRVPPQGPLPKP